MSRLSFYRVDAGYADYLREFDHRVPYTFDDKQNRPFVGVIITLCDTPFFVPLSSPKEKHLTMHNMPDFHKIEGGEWGAINFNNMIPVPEKYLTLISTELPASYTEEQYKYINLLKNQLTWCNITKNKDMICNKANRLYDIITTNKATQKLKNRCCNFDLLMKIYNNYES